MHVADSNSSKSTMPLFHAAWLFGCGIAAAHFLWLRPSLLLAAQLPMAAICVLAAVCARRIVWAPLGVLWMMLGAWCAQMEPQQAADRDLATLSDGLLRTVEGTVVDTGPVRAEREQNVDEPSPVAPAERIDLRLSSVEIVTDDADFESPVSGGVRLTVQWLPAEPGAKAGAIARADARPFGCGDRVRAVVRLLPPETYRDPGGFSRVGYLLGQGITSTASVSIDRIERTGHSAHETLACRASALQHRASAQLLQIPAAMRGMPKLLRLSEDDAILLAAMVTGDRTYLDRSLRSGFERTGSFHMLVVSGFHLAIAAAIVFWLARRLRLPRVAATLATVGASFAYALFTGFATPVQRSLWMVALYLLGRLIYRQRSHMNTIGFAALCLLAASPRSLFDSGFQMTLLAVVSIAGVAAPLLAGSIHPYLAAMRTLRLVAIDSKLEPRVAQFRVLMRASAEALQLATERERGSRIAAGIAWGLFPFAVRAILRCAEMVAVACVVELAMAFPMAAYFHRITLFALPVNLFILPLLLVLMPAALLTLVLAMISPTAAIVPAMATALPLHFGEWLVGKFGSLALGDVRVPAPLAGQVLIFLLLLAFAMWLARRTRHWMRRCAWTALAIAAFVVVVPRPVDRARSALLVEVLDVGQGDSILMITPDGKTLLIDGGGFGGGPRQAPQDFDIGEEVVSPALWARGIRHLDAVALSHAHSDHMGGLPAVLRNFHPAELWVGNNPHIGAYDALLREAAGFRIAVRTLRAGDALMLGGVQINVLAPLPGYKPGAEPSNNDSLVLRAAFGATSVLLEGDAEAPIEQAMLGETGLKSSLLKVGHHGSISSTRPEFLARVAPDWAVISCGLHNRYGHPRTEVLEELEAAHVHTFRTDLDGAMCFVLDGNAVTAEPMCGDRHP